MFLPRRNAGIDSRDYPNAIHKKDKKNTFTVFAPKCNCFLFLVSQSLTTTQCVTLLDINWEQKNNSNNNENGTSAYMRMKVNETNAIAWHCRVAMFTNNVWPKRVAKKNWKWSPSWLKILENDNETEYFLINWNIGRGRVGVFVLCACSCMCVWNVQRIISESQCNRHIENLCVFFSQFMYLLALHCYSIKQKTRILFGVRWCVCVCFLL